MSEKKWFFIEMSCTVNIQKDSVLIYHSFNGKAIEFLNNPEVASIVRRLKAARNMGVIPLGKEELGNPAISNFVKQIRDNFMGDLLDIGFSDCKPVQMIPRPRLLGGVKYIQGEKTPKVSGERILDNLCQITVYLTDRCSNGCHFCNRAHRQFTWCMSDNGNQGEMRISQLDYLFYYLQGSEGLAVNMVGGDLFSYSRVSELIGIIRDCPVKKNVFFHFLQASNHLSEMGKWVDGKTSFVILVNFPVDDRRFAKVADAMKEMDPAVKFHFLIESEDDFSRAEKAIKTFSLRQAEYHPFFNGKNLEMFRENVFVDKNDISTAKLSRKKIFANQMVNSLHFGKLIALPDGKIKANIHDPALGIIGKHSLQEIVYKELTRGKSWRKTRHKVVPCKHCLYVDLCPPLSNYNRVIGRNDLCHMTADLKRSLGAKKR